MSIFEDKEFELCKIMTATVKRMRKKEDEFLSKYNLTHFHGVYIAHLYRFKALTMNELTEKVGVDKANTSRVVKDLLNKGYIEKIGDSERKFSLKLTESGNKVALNFRKNVDNFMNIILSNFTEDEKNSMHHLLNKFLQGVNLSINS